MYGKFKIEYTWARNMFIMSNINYCLSDVTLEGVIEAVKKFKFEYIWARNMFIMSNMDYYLSVVGSDGVNGYV